jgi:hypothetical protein
MTGLIKDASKHHRLGNRLACFGDDRGAMGLTRVTMIASLGGGRASAFASSNGARIQTSVSSLVRSRTGIA